MVVRLSHELKSKLPWGLYKMVGGVKGNTFTLVKFEALKAPAPIEITLSGISIFVKLHYYYLDYRKKHYFHLQ